MLEDRIANMGHNYDKVVMSFCVKIAKIKPLISLGFQVDIYFTIY